MKNVPLARSLIAIVLSTVVVSGSAWAEETVATKAENAVEKVSTSIDKSVDKVGSSIDNSMKKVDNFMGDSTITAKVKSALLDDKSIESTHISIETTGGVVTLSGFVTSTNQMTQANEVAGKVEGVKSVSNKLQVQEDKGSTVESFVSDSAITSEVKAKFLADKIVPSRKIKVETSEGVVLLTGNVDKAAQAKQAESIAKQVEGVKTVKN
ncbi:molecular chaperone OsmY [Jinshanibacter sp. LJY008]|uniref:Osmotically-inducible protein Y n=1 Tax=Limnobaculum eriocheiris TaxID=2897391 RepID=A0A9X1MTK0_9GAMM|nr:molecular chaperone OsmY [Limnobaculum eriocheiris]MCD1125311.1 molecular chaperone OsmY [Limnobaculum eriocheiris]